ncbi:glutathione S-transferase N-terminal domain-containing protein [Myxococcus sp. K15C18031901]|uniref:glutathione S-transferase family protein n=1 Tax=Myxococcus dinghuensis TaxID=2906761 RepID=UPI0020A766C8|nr:glutathione S-transferase N-terminal domain-containing protein [Myxococcus dinghuensis]MCP3099787.1 glutathione S-transferase N-terminal domain-containing protein [Myxococcus dinghuensis]
MRTLHGIGYSPWTEKSRWALDHHRVEYRYREHTPLIDELALRWRTPKGTHPSVPQLSEDTGVTTGSFAIARRAEAQGQGSPLFPEQALPTIQRWEAVSDRVLAIGRSSVVRRMAGNPAFQRESLPGFIPKALRGLFAPSAALGARFIARKHRADPDPEASLRETVVPALEQLRAELKGRPYLEGGFTYADITACAMLQLAVPAADTWLPLGPATRETWRHEPLVAAFADLVEWRDALYAKHRRP